MGARDWREPDLGILDDEREPVPAAPAELLPQPWAAWIAETQQATGAPADVLTYMPAVAWRSGTGMVVWNELAR